MRPEMQRRQSNTYRVLAVFFANKALWISWTVFADLVGERAYRTRISNAKKIVVKAGGTIESRTFREGQRIITEYRYLDHVPLGRSADVPAVTAWPVPGAPYGPQPFELTAPSR